MVRRFYKHIYMYRSATKNQFFGFGKLQNMEIRWKFDFETFDYYNFDTTTIYMSWILN